MIIVEPMGGLGNRMRVIASGIWLRAQLQTKLIIVWNENYELNCPFDCLFEQSDLFTIRKKNIWHRYLRSNYQQTALLRFWAKLINGLAGVSFCVDEADFPVQLPRGSADLYAVAHRFKNIYIRTCREFGDNQSALESFQPVEEIALRVAEVARQFNEYTIGIHIRQTDNLPSVQYSPVRLFVSAMQEALAKQAATNFFVCSDDLQVKRDMVALFGDRVITSLSPTARDSTAGIVDAAAELYCLSTTRWIFGSYYSSYGEIAARIGHVELKVLKETGKDE